MEGEKGRTWGYMGTQKEKTTIYKSVHISGAKHYKVRCDKKIYIFSGITKRQFKELPNARVVGYFTREKNQGDVTEDVGGRLFQIKKGARGRTDKLNFVISNAPKKLHRTVCYVPVGGNDYLVYQQLPVAAALAPVGTVAAAAAVGYLVYAGHLGVPDLPKNPLGIASTVNIGGDGSDTEAEMESIDFAGYDMVSVSASNPYVLLQNPESNDVYFSYVLSDASGNEFMRTDLIPPGKALQWDAKKDLGSGTHNVKMHIDTFDMVDTAIPYNAMNYDKVTVVVE